MRRFSREEEEKISKQGVFKTKERPDQRLSNMMIVLEIYD